ncbi:ABC transporter permease [Paracoccaceae bacterium GXU_MW_L88]
MNTISRSRLGDFGLLGVLIILVLVFSVIAPNFTSANNMLNILRNAALVAIVAIPMTFVLISGEIDISSGPLAAFAGVSFALLVTQAGVGMTLAFILILLVGFLSGAFVGAMRSYFNVPSFVTTLALWGALRGLAIWSSNGHAVFIQDSSYRVLLGGDWLGVPVPVYFAAVVFLGYFYIAKYTAFGRSVYAVGGNEASARLVGIAVSRIKILALAATGLFAALVGLLIDARLSSGNANAAEGFEFDVIAAVVVGGASLSGGSGNVTGTLIGVLFIAVLSNGLVLLGMNPYLQSVVRGLVILLAVLLNVAVRRKA